MPILFRSMLAGLASLIALPAVAADCKPAHMFKTIAPGVLTVTTFEFPPYDTVGSDGTLGGVDGDILKRIAEKECLTVKPVTVDTAAAIQYVVSGQADLTSGDWYRTAARAKVLGLSAPLYLDQLGIFSKQGFSKISDLTGKQVGTVQGYLWVSDMQKLFGPALHVYPNPVALAQDLVAGRIDVGADSYAVGVAAQKTGGYAGIKIEVAQPDERVKASVQPGQSAFPYAKSNTGLGAALDADIADLQKAGAVADILKAHGLDPKAANVGEPRLIQ